MKLAYDLDKIKFATDSPTFERAVGIYESGGIKNFKDDGFSFTAEVKGSQGDYYRVSVSVRHYDSGDCDCYLGQNDTLCKHMVAVAIQAVMGGQELSREDKELIRSPKCSGRTGELSRSELAEAKRAITSAMRYIKPYNGPSRIWFAYQNSLLEGVNRLSKLASELPASQQTAGLLIDMLLRLDKKLCEGGVDDSDGAVGGFIEEAVLMLKNYAELDPACIKAFKKFSGRETCFDWEEPLLELL